ncbi:hypothetical protein, partial [Thiolapillus sp.]|uniref:hypothetical protein n=1 Tax=Thiolapillus sp. TaxID=2017437 RepID=UPI003AF4CBA5
MSIDFSYVVKFQEKVCTGSGGENRCGFLGAYDTGNSRIQLEALRQQVETALEDIKEQEIRLREDVMEQSGS